MVIASLCLHYVPEDNAKQMLDKLMFMEDFVGEERTFDDGASDSSNAEDIAFVRTADGELLIRLCHPNPCPSQSENPNEQNAQNVCVAPSQNYASHSSSILTVLTAPLAARLGKVSRDFLSGQNANFATTSYRCTVIFSHHTNTSLAVRQTSALMDKLSAEMERNIVPNFH
uniref:Protein kinase domain-containing protein n=1 Tax=Globodera pallida TaxID=36090 RepID=A0A183CCZ3_GLOPA